MPRDRKPRKTKSKRKAAKAKSKRTRVNVNRALQPIAQRYICKMKYAEVVATDAAGMYAFNLNSIFDPNRTGVGHQPYGHDTLQTLYNRYRVISCGWRITCLRTVLQDGGQAPVVVASMPANEVLTFSTTGEVLEQPRAKYITQNPGATALVLKGKSYLPSLVGRNKAQYMADDRYQATFGASPSELGILNIFTGATSGNAAPAIALHVVLEYIVEVFDIKHLAQS